MKTKSKGVKLAAFRTVAQLGNKEEELGERHWELPGFG
jgi:hypothetical protein